jgi:hypothetical protein
MSGKMGTLNMLSKCHSYLSPFFLDFVGKGIALADIPSVVMQAVSKGRIVDTNGSAPV